MKRKRPIDILGRNNAEYMIKKLNGGAALAAAIGFACLVIALVFSREPIIMAAFCYAGALSGITSLLFLKTSMSTASSNAIFRDRDESMAAIRILESDRRERQARTGGT